MTSFGKLLVYLNVFAAMILCGWAVSLYANRVDWFDRTTGEGKVDGELTRLSAEVKRYAEQIKAAQVAYANVAFRLANDYESNSEAVRDLRAARLALRMAEVKRIDDKVRFREQLREPKSALIDFRNEGPEVNGITGKPLEGLGNLRKKFDELTNKSLNHKAAIRKYRTEYESLDEQVQQVQAEVLRQKVIYDNLKDEQDYLADALINWQEQLRTLEIRQKQLQDRLDDLRSLPKKRVTLNR